jgi:hypothetical protein
VFGNDLGRQGDQCTEPSCYQAKMAPHVAKSIEAKPELVQISTAYGQQKNGSVVLPRNTTRQRVISAVVAAVPVRLLKGAGHEPFE